MKKTLRQWRLINDFTQKKLAEKAGVTPKSISNYETNIENLRRASYDNLDRIARALGVKVDDIFLGGTSIK